MEGRLEGRYELLGHLGAGESATVFLAQDLALDRRIALKLASAPGEEGAARLRREYQLLGRLNHAHLPNVFEFGWAQGCCYFTMELLDGDSLETVGPTLDEAVLATLLFQACRLLAYLDRRGLVHGDLKPPNLFVVQGALQTPLLKVIDLGLGGAAGEGQRGLIRGTPRYAAPSILAGEPPTARSDLHALGASFLEVVGRWEGSDVEERAVDAALLQVLERMVARDPDTRYQSAEDVLVDLRRAGAAEGEKLFDGTPFVGRKRELACLQALGEELRNGEPAGRLVLLLGEAGMGKSALLEEMRRALELHDMLILQGRASPEASGSLSAWSSVLGHLELLGDEPVDGEDPVEGIARLLERVACKRRLWVVLEDAQWLDEASLRLLDLLARRRTRASWVILLAVRSNEVDDSGERALRELGARHSLFSLELEPLPRGDARTLLAGLAPGMDAHTSERIVTETHGRPLFLSSAARAVIARPDASVDAAIHAGMPSMMVAELDRRIDELTPEELQAALSLAVLVRPASLESIATLHAVSLRTMADLLERLAERELLQVESNGAARLYILVQRTLRTALLSRMSTQERKRRNARALMAWKATVGDGAEQAPVLFAHALGAGDTQQVLHYGGLSVEGLLHGQAPGTAKRSVQRLRAYLIEVGMDPDRHLAELEGDVHLGLSELPQARSRYERALELELSSGEPAARVRLWRKVARTQEAAGEYERAREVLARALEEIEAQDGAEAARLCGALSKVDYRLGRPAEAERWLQRGLEALAGAPESAAIASLWNNLGVLAYDRSEHAEARSYWRRALAIHEADGDRANQGKALSNLGTVAMVLGRLDEAREAFEAANAIKSEIGNRRSLATTLSNLAMLDRWQGQLGRAIQRLESVLRLREEIGDAAGAAQSHLSLALVWLDKGELARARRHAHLATRTARGTGERDTVLTEALLAEACVDATAGCHAQAEARIEEGLAVVGEIGNRSEEARFLVLRAELLLQRVARPYAREAETDAPEANRDRARAGFERAVTILRDTGEPRSLGLALLAACEGAIECGQEDVSEELVEEVAGIAERLGLPHVVGRVELCRGRIAYQRGDMEPASAFLSRALSIAQVLGTPELEWRACEALALYHDAQGQRARAVSWLGSCVSVFQRVVGTLKADRSLQDAYLEAPLRARVLMQLEQWIEE